MNANARLPLVVPSHEDLSRLARDDPPAFEELRRKLIDNLIDNAAEMTKPRLRGIQFQVDCLRRLSRSALGSTVRIYELMWKSFLELNYSCQDFAHLEYRLSAGKYPALANGEARKADSARVIEFRPQAARKAAKKKAE